MKKIKFNLSLKWFLKKNLIFFICLKSFFSFCIWKNNLKFSFYGSLIFFLFVFNFNFFSVASVLSLNTDSNKKDLFLKNDQDRQFFVASSEVKRGLKKSFKEMDSKRQNERRRSDLTVKNILTLKIKPFVKIYSSSGIKLVDFIDKSELDKSFEKRDFSFYKFFENSSKTSFFSKEELLSFWRSFQNAYFLNFPKVKNKIVLSSKDFKKYLDSFKKSFQKKWSTKKTSEKLGSFIHFIIPNRVTVENRGFEVSKESIKAHLLSQWKRQCEDCEFIFLSLKVSPIRDHLQGQPWKISFPSRLPRGSFSLPLHFVNLSATSGRRLRNLRLSDEKWMKEFETQRTYWIRGKLEIYKEVPVLNRKLGLNTRIREGDFNFSFKKINFFSERKLPLRKEVLGKKLKMELKAGDILWKSTLLREKAVKKGDIVKVKLNKKSWSVVLMGQAIEEGAIGDHVKILNLNSKKVISARVIHKGEVLVK